jgi:hypothetical protein
MGDNIKIDIIRYEDTNWIKEVWGNIQLCAFVNNNVFLDSINQGIS